MARKNQRSDRRAIAAERMAILFDQAGVFYHEHPDWSNRCVEHARKIAMKERVRIPAPFSRQFCRRCSRFLVPGSSSRVRISRGMVTVTCIGCGYARRYPIRQRR